MGFIEPLAFAFAALYGVLVLFYLWERWRRRVTVPSLMLWMAVREDTIRASRFRPDLLFLLQFLLLTCLIAGLARPYVRAGGADAGSTRRILVLDTSASMQAVEGRRSRFEQARAQALSVLQGLPANAEVMLIRAGATSEVVGTFSTDHDAVAKALAETVPTDTGGDLGTAVALADSASHRDDVPTEIEAFTDIPRSQLPAPLRDRVTVFQVGESDDNLGIEALQIFQGRFQDYRSARAHVLVQNFAHREEHGFLTVQLEDAVVHRTGFTIPARETRGFLIHDFPGPGRVVAQLDVADALAVDNTAYGWIRPMTPVHVLVVSEPSPLLQDLRGLAAATPGLQLTFTNPADFAPPQAPEADLVIFHGVVPPTEPLANALYVYPPETNPLFPVEGEATNIEVLDWNARHAALQSLRPLAALPLQRARIVKPPDWSEVLLWSRTIERQFPLALAGEHDGRRVACLTFDLDAERLLSSDNVNVFLLFMNLLAWLTPERDAAAVVVRTGEVQSFADLPANPLRVMDPRGNEYTVPSTRPMVEPLFAGEYRIRSDGTGRTLLANFFDPVESDIGRASKEPPVLPSPPAQPAAPGTSAPRHEYGTALWYAAAALFLLEWIAARRLSRER